MIYSDEYYNGHDIVVSRPKKPVLVSAKTGADYRKYADELDAYEKRHEFYRAGVAAREAEIMGRQRNVHNEIMNEYRMSVSQFKVLWYSRFTEDLSLNEKIETLEYLLNLISDFNNVKV